MCVCLLSYQKLCFYKPRMSDALCSCILGMCVLHVMQCNLLQAWMWVTVAAAPQVRERQHQGYCLCTCCTWASLGEIYFTTVQSKRRTKLHLRCDLSFLFHICLKQKYHGIFSCSSRFQYIYMIKSVTYGHLNFCVVDLTRKESTEAYRDINRDENLHDFLIRLDMKEDDQISHPCSS